jgi:hypothetical protein
MFGFQVKVNVMKEGKPDYEWQWVQPTGGQPYAYETADEAEYMRRICYGNDFNVSRVQEFPK